jgi:hypothetical protein
MNNILFSPLYLFLGVSVLAAGSLLLAAGKMTVTNCKRQEARSQ